VQERFFCGEGMPVREAKLLPAKPPCLCAAIVNRSGSDSFVIAHEKR
jgi:hypothetical protein